MNKNYKIYCDDCLNVMSGMEDESVDLVVTDPPYKTITGGDSNGKNSVRPKGMLSGNRKLFQHQKLEISVWIPEIFRVLKSGSHCYVFTNVLNLTDMLNETRKVGFQLHNLLVWEKNNCTPSQYYMKNCEYVLFLRKGRAKWINDIGGSKTVHRFDNIIGKKTHPCEKPTELLSFYINNSSRNGDIVFDPFMGTGNTGVASLQSERKFIGVEIDKEYFSISEEKLKNIEVVNDA